MKLNDIFIIIGTLAYSWLFYDQLPGINFLIFGILMVVLFAARDFSVLFKPSWLAVAAAVLVSSFYVYWWGTALTVIANIFSLILLAGFSFKADSSLLITFINSFFSICFSVFVNISQFTSQRVEKDAQEGMFRKLLLVVIPLLVTLIFFFIYRSANPVFEKFTGNLTDKFSLGWVLFTISGFVLLFGAFRHSIINYLTKADDSASDSLAYISEEQHMQTGIGKWMKASSELLMGVVMFVLLNLLLVSVNGLDIYYMWIVKSIPEGITVAEYLHDGTNTLIISIVMAISVLLFVFRGYLNFIDKNRLLRLLAYGWIAQNALLVITTAQRNWWIIESSGLTRKRIGVYVYLLLCLIGLTTTLIKVARSKSNWFLFRKNAWAFYAVLIISCIPNWDDYIVRFNYTHFKSLDFEYIDRGYQSNLSYTCMATLFELYAQEQGEITERKVFTKTVIDNMYLNYAFLIDYGKADWQSTCHSKTDALKRIEALVKSGKIKSPA